MQGDYDNASDSIKDSGNGSIRPKDSIVGNKVTIGRAGGADVLDLNSCAVYGAKGQSGDTVANNEVWINSGKMGSVNGGIISADLGTVTNNKVYISGRPTFAADSVIYGGYSASGGEVSGNILNIKSTGITVSNIKNFDVYNFYLPDTVQAGDVLLTVTSGSSNEQTDLKGSSVNVGHNRLGSGPEVGR